MMPETPPHTQPGREEAPSSLSPSPLPVIDTLDLAFIPQESMASQPTQGSQR